MELIFELIFSLIFEGSIEGLKSKKVPFWLRIICAVIVGLVFLAVFSLIAYFAVLFWKEENYVIAFLFMVIDLILFIFTFNKIKGRT